MFDVWSAVRWWDEWQLRILVLASLGVQWFMLVAAPLRKYTIPQYLRTLTWLAYISSDALAIYALATLFNRHAKASNGVSCSGSNGGKAGVLEILWAPVLLIHLGGQREVTAYTIEDNELWTRHTVTLVSQVAVALYAFYKSWPDSADTKLWATAVLLFVIGVLSFCEKPWAFYRARIHRLEAVSSLIQGTRQRKSKWCFCFNELDEENMSRACAARCTFCRRMAGRAGDDDDDGSISRPAVAQQEQDKVWSVRNKVHMILSDLSLFAAAYDWISRRQPHDSVSRLKARVKEILGPAVGAEKFSKTWLVRAFGLIYTRYNVVWTPAYLAYHFMLVPALHAAAITLFAVAHKRGVYDSADVKTTYILLSFTAALDVSGVSVAELLHRLMNKLDYPALCEWIAQYNLIDAALRRRRPGIMGSLIIKCRLERYILWERNNLFNKVAGYLIIDLLNRNKYSTAGLDLGNYRNLELGAPNWVLTEDQRREYCREGKLVRTTLQASFDKSVLIWHIATDLCLSFKPPAAPLSSREVRIEAISNYMSHLLNFRPDMLLTGSRRHLFAEAMDILRQETLPVGRHFKHPPNDKALAECILRHAEDDTYPLLNHACKLAKELLQLPDDDRFELMYRVWIGMLFYSATMCRGYLHAKSLGEGGEFLSFVWLLLCTTGSKTLADKLQMPPDKAEDSQETKLPETFEGFKFWTADSDSEDHVI